MGIEIKLNKPDNTTEKTTEVDISKLDKSIEAAEEAAEEAAKKLEAPPNGGYRRRVRTVYGWSERNNDT